MILLLDIGNTRIKWRIVDGEGGCLLQSAFDPEAGLGQFIGAIAEYELSRLLVAEVGNVLMRYQLLEVIKQVFADIQIEKIESEAQCLGVTNSYAQPQRLGVDRWLGVVEAWCVNDGRPVAVFDFGTAAKLDVVAEARHQGGHIVPGLAMMRQALLENTSKVRFEAQNTYQQGWGCSTASAVENGTWVMLMAWLERELQAFMAAYPEGVVYIIGGDAEYFSQSAVLQKLLANIIFADNLVLDALWRITCIKQG